MFTFCELGWGQKVETAQKGQVLCFPQLEEHNGPKGSVPTGPIPWSSSPRPQTVVLWEAPTYFDEDDEKKMMMMMKIGGESEQVTWRSPSYCLESIVTLVQMCSLETSNHTRSFITTFLKFPSWPHTHAHTHNCVCWNTLLEALGQFCGHTFIEVLSVSISLTL